MTTRRETSFWIGTVTALLFVGFAPTAETSGETVSGAERLQDDWFYNPFNEHSAHHRPIGTGAIYADEEHPAVQDWLKGRQLNINVGDRPHGLYMIDADEEGPVLTVNRRAEARAENLPTAMRFPAGGVAIDFPEYFDGNIVVYDRTVDVFNHLRVYAWNDGEPVAMQYRRYAPDIVGHGSRLGERIGTSASGVAAPFGILSELTEATRTIYPHVRMVLNSVPEEGKVKFRVGDRMTTPTGGPNKQIIPGEFPAGGGTPLAPSRAM